MPTQESQYEVHEETKASSVSGSDNVIVNKKAWGALWGLLGVMTTAVVVAGVKAYRDSHADATAGNNSTGGQGTNE